MALTVRGEGQIGFIHDEANLRAAAAKPLQIISRDEGSGGVVRIADEHRIGEGGGFFKSVQVGPEAVRFPAQEEFKRHPLEAAGVGIIGISRAHDQCPVHLQCGGDGINELGGSVSGDQTVGGNPEMFGVTPDDPLVVHFRQRAHGLDLPHEIVAQAGRRTERIDVAAQVDDLRRIASQPAGQFVYVAAVATDHRRPPMEAIRNRPASTISVNAPSISPVTHPNRRL